MPQARIFFSSLDDRLLWIDPLFIPKVLHIGCGHRKRYAVSRLQDRRPRWECTSCGAEWFEAEEYW